MHLSIDPASATAPYEQVVAQVVAGIGDGSIPVGTRLPPVRALAAELGLAVNTVAKAYKQLEGEGHVQTRGRGGTVVLGPDGADATQLAAERLAATARERGLSLDEAIGVLRRAW